MLNVKVGILFDSFGVRIGRYYQKKHVLNSKHLRWLHVTSLDALVWSDRFYLQFLNGFEICGSMTPALQQWLIRETS